MRAKMLIWLCAWICGSAGAAEVRVIYGEKVSRFTIEKVAAEKEPARLVFNSNQDPGRTVPLNLENYEYLLKKAGAIRSAYKDTAKCRRRSVTIEVDGKTTLGCLVGKQPSDAQIRDLLGLMSMVL